MNDVATAFTYRKIVVTGGAGFLGRFVVARLSDYPNVEVLVPRSKLYDFVAGRGSQATAEDTKPELVVHLAAVVGGIGHNQKNPRSILLR